MKEIKPLISIIIPVYNVEKLLNKCVDSVLAQTYPHIEVVLVDDGSTDDSGGICDSLADDRRVMVIHKPNGGLSSARNAGIDVSTGEYIGFVDSDDMIDPGMYQELYQLAVNQDKMIACAGISFIDEKGKTKPFLFADRYNNQEKTDYFTALLLHKGDASSCTKLFHRRIFDNCRFREGRLNEDVLFMFEASQNYDGISYTPKIGYYYFVRSGSISRHFGKALHDMVTNAQEIREIVDRDYPELKVYVERFEIFQNVAFLVNVPPGFDRKSDPMCAQTLQFIRQNLFVGWKNPYLRLKDKLVLTALCVAPRVVPILLERKK